ncbi:MAG: transcription antitermination factor NusB [Desulfobacterales bacterium]|uniref:Transcription antitermination protein NusB n=1 Tax=Candidatus Desulfatibia profunda TaxID=2841695 RepID=A0A8J6TM38_9BACT|nr:transcription antitermination factor NusB [Candidatus Desulfatibia profunda]MBL7179556.1 transcription antitermination factor NusB [Desulfobacterales bacterium]
MGYRRKSRELAMQALFYMDMGQNDSKEMLERFCENFTPSKKALPFFLKLVKGVMHARPEIDAVIERFSNNWKLSRMAGVDRNIMRIAVYELICCHDIPCKVSINEAIDIGKKFGTEESGAFINGILDSIRLALEKKDIDVKLDIPTNDMV